MNIKYLMLREFMRRERKALGARDEFGKYI